MTKDVDPQAKERAGAEQRAEEAAARVVERVVACVRAIMPADDRRIMPPRFAALPDGLRDALRDELRAYALALRALEAPPEHVLLRVKRLTAEALDRARTSSPELMQAIATWSIEGYFSSDGHPTP